MDGGTLISILPALIDRAQPEWKKAQQALGRRFKDEVARAIADHHGYVVSWCQEAHVTFLAAVAPDASTVDLAFRAVPRRLGVMGRELDELDVLLGPAHVAVLGDVGAGKTTTLRRLAQHVALEGPSGAEEDWNYVVVIVCREERWDEVELYDVLGRIVGVTGKLRDELDNPDSRIRHVLDIGALVIIDGLDEVPPRHRSNLERDVTQLGRHLQRGKIIVSCRSADYVAALPGFDTAEIQPLSREQIRRLVDQLLGSDDAAAFHQALAGLRAAELANRPLFLTYMAAIYRRRGTIPDRPIDLYEAITRLVIQEWDEQRGVRRSSKWAEFGIDDKRRFLADLAYELTRREIFRFDEQVLADLYGQLADRYQLPKGEARLVAKELESHTGLLTEIGGEYEFSHLSLQEYLAADAMVRGPASARSEWWSTYPAVAAMAVAMSSDANTWLRDLLTQMPINLDDPRPLAAFLDRLGQERPRFVRSEQLGRDLLALVQRARIADAESVSRLRENKPVRDSVADALSTFNSIKVGGNDTRAARYEGRSRTPQEVISIPTPVIEALVGAERLRQTALEVERRH